MRTPQTRNRAAEEREPGWARKEKHGKMTELNQVRNEKIKTRTELDEFIESALKPNNFPDLPQMTYQRKGWLSFEEFLA